MRGLNTSTWALILLLPLVPVVALYWFFSGQNFFDLKDTAKGIVATGPIAAYVALVLIGWQIFRSGRRLAPDLDPQGAALVGEYAVTSTSGHNAVYTGGCSITNQMGSLVVSGHFDHSGKHVGNYTSQCVWLRDSQLMIAYTLREIRDGAEHTTEGLARLALSPDPAAPLRGTWTVLGRQNMVGTVIYTRQKRS